MAKAVSALSAQEGLWGNVRHVLALALPVALAELGWVR